MQPSENRPSCDITLEDIGLFLQSRGWEKIEDYCWRDPLRGFMRSVHWSMALEIQFARDHKATAAGMARSFEQLVGASAGTGGSR